MPVKQLRTGLNALKRRVSARGMDALDGRSQAYRRTMEWRAEILRDLGGDISAQRMTLVEIAVRTRLFLDHVDSYLMLEMQSLVNKRRRSLWPVVRERTILADSLARMLSQLGLDRQAKQVEDLETYQQRRAVELERETRNEQQAQAADDSASD